MFRGNADHPFGVTGTPCYGQFTTKVVLKARVRTWMGIPESGPSDRSASARTR
jgi:hypothetical protein